MKKKPSFIQKFHSNLSAMVGWMDFQGCRWPFALALMLTLMVAFGS